MISDADLYRLAVFLGSTSMVLIVLYHFLEINGDGASNNKVEAAKGAPIKKQVAN
jgi:hypothetical protein